ncbi:MAG: HlyC/CorC family transporter [Lachnospiraceae bacterium]|nr:HlyC/CorC family transporter [Lachnospiraceae bacterium]
MSTTSITQLIVLVVLLLLSAFFSSAETAFTTTSRIRMRTLAESGSKKAARVLTITDDMHKMLSAILIGNNIVNLSASSIATTLAIKLFGSMGAGIATGVLTLLILIFGEISPKTLATIYADQISLAYSSVIYGLMYLLTPVIYIVNQLSMGFLKLLRVDPHARKSAMTEDEFKTIVDVGHETGVLENSEHKMINNMFDFGDSQAKEIMIPRIDMTFAQLDNTYPELIEIFREDKFTRLPVYEESTDNVVGIINMKDLLLCNDPVHFHIRDLIREPYFTYEHKNTSELFLEMQKNSINIAIVLDEYGVTAGMITLEDLLEEIVGEIRDEYDADEEYPLVKINDREYYIQGSMNLGDLCDELDLPFRSEDYDTVGGYLIGLLDHLPEKNEIAITKEDILLQVTKMDKNRIEKIYMKLPAPKDI